MSQLHTGLDPTTPVLVLKNPNPLSPYGGKQDPPPKRGTHVPGPVSSSSSSSSKWATNFFKAASSVKASAEAGIAKLSGPSRGQGGTTRTSTSNGGQVEVCPTCNVKFSKIGDLIDHVEKVHEKNGVMKATLDVCPKCSKGFRYPVSLVEHVEREHRGTFKA